MAFPHERAYRQLLESIIWRRGRFHSHCGGLKTWAIRGKTARYGLYECAYCHHQFTVNTRTPLHATKLPLKKWIQAFFLVLTSSKGISSVVLARLLGLNQKTDWKVGHAIREMMDLRQEEGPALDDIVEADEKFIGGRPKFRRGVKHKRGRSTDKPPVFIEVARRGQVRAAVIERNNRACIELQLERFVRPSASLITDKNGAYTMPGRAFASHEVVDHSKKEYARGAVHMSSADGFAVIIEQAQFGVYHWTSRRHLQCYVDEAVFHWNQRRWVKKGKGRYKRFAMGFADGLKALLKNAVGR
ncbi:IS1595 family transposase [Shumkonia mesophila]|uniref:IS1595 family transposase n=1 Tax=Shumkonia mesophila TaxID=2838854 RepID=UPI002934675E|nr:IS1595 family transposase [Shumkonia mesophila]